MIQTVRGLITVKCHDFVTSSKRHFNDSLIGIEGQTLFRLICTTNSELNVNLDLNHNE